MTIPMHSFPFPLAPMDGYTNSPVRQLMRTLGAGFLVTEFVPADQIRINAKKVRDRIAFHENEQPVGIQIYGNNIAHMVDAAQYVEQMGAAFVDFNFGCPAKGITSKGKGAAWLCKPLEMYSLLKETRAKVGLPISIKIRTGFDTENAHEIIKVAEETGVNWITIHGRTRAQGYKAPINWDYLKELASQSKIPVIVNGDIRKPEGALDIIKQKMFSGVMIGRAALLNPLFFAELRKLFDPAWQPPCTSLHDVLSLFYALATDTYGHTHDAAFLLARVCVHWAYGFPNEREFRIKLFKHAWTASPGLIRDVIATHLEENVLTKSRGPTERFLMAGSG